LKHSLDISTAKTIISTHDLAGFVPDNLKHYSINLSSFQDIPSPTASGISAVNLNNLPNPKAEAPCAKAALEDVSFLIYTSGTTGKPKACAVRNFLLAATSNTLPHDARNPKKYFPLRTYSALPLFHATALFTGVFYCFGNSSTLCLARKFSTSRFWEDVVASRATRMLYVGELCRYLVSAPPSPYDRAHSCIVANGNGLRSEIWEKFRDRFGIPEIREFYRSTEGMARLDNFGTSAAGAGKIGFRGLLGRYLENDTFIVRVDPLTEEVYRDPKTGFCVEVGLGEPGEAIGRVKDKNLLIEYLNNSEASEQKLLRDVFVNGDCFQRMGDLLLRDSDGWIQFHDRIGDTYRWKGENVSAGEVRDHIARLSGVQDAVVYGVKLPR
jgi:acyl-CoA synthetase (AMP-forming)/AMP-acid ligase II